MLYRGTRMHKGGEGVNADASLWPPVYWRGGQDRGKAALGRGGGENKRLAQGQEVGRATEGNIGLLEQRKLEKE